MSLRDLLCLIFPFLQSSPVERAFEFQAAAPIPGETPTLTAREIEVAWCIRAGLSNEKIAARLNISLSTVKTHVHHLLLKFRVHSRWELRDLLLERWDEPPASR